MLLRARYRTATAQGEQRTEIGFCKTVRSTRSIVRATLCAFLVVAIGGCAGLFGPSEPDPAARMPALEKRIFALVVEKRLAVDPKAHALSFDPTLSDVARERSAKMAKADSFAGDGDPHGAATLLMRQDAKFQGLVVENVAAQHFTPGQDIDVETFAKRFVDTWAASKAHLETLSFADFERSGIGATANGHTIYVAQVFTVEFAPGDKTEPVAPTIKTVPSLQDTKDKPADLPPAAGSTAPKP
jgi:uncharacterized protein YkwD